MLLTVRAHMPRTMRISGPGGMTRGETACSSVTSDASRGAWPLTMSDRPGGWGAKDGAGFVGTGRGAGAQSQPGWAGAQG
jgi:hypothetical protein